MKTESLDAIFSSCSSIPEQFRLAGPVEQRRYLCDGEIREWEGPMHEVCSPV